MYHENVYEQPALVEVGFFAERTLGNEPSGLPESSHFVWIP